MNATLYTPITVGNYELSNRMIMAPLTRMRAPERIATDLMAAYYAQRATAGLIITEATIISPQGAGYPATPGIYTKEQVSSWKNVCDAVHDKNGRIFLQLWHVGRISHPDLLDGETPVAPSAITPQGVAVTAHGMKPFICPRALELTEIGDIIKHYQTAAQNALDAGFDGVEIHSANGYLLDQFLRDGSNKRTDNYGGSFENRSRFLLETVKAVVDVCGSGKVGVRLSPSGTFNDMSDSDPTSLFIYVTEQLNAFNLAYLHIVDALEGDIRHGAKVVELSALREAYKGALVVCGGYDRIRAENAVAHGLADAVAFGQLYIANPDLPARFKSHADLNIPDAKSFYGGNAQGYTDYPALGD
jgi:N-ethylmaleimide reductase